jgi:hypothetical protein
LKAQCSLRKYKKKKKREDSTSMSVSTLRIGKWRETATSLGRWLLEEYH